MTYPRTGVNFLQESIKQKTDCTIEFNHAEFSTEEVIINIVRNPKESMISWISMMDTYGDEGIKKNNFDKLINLIMVKKYINMYNFLLSRDTIFVNYKDFNNIDNLVIKLCNIVDLKVLNTEIINEEEIHKINSLKEGGYLISSKNTDLYNMYKEKFDSVDLAECYTLYKKALDRCITI
jgi:hypothetical protein